MASLATALPGLALLVVGPLMAWIVLRARPEHAQNQRLAALLVVAALSMGTYGGLRVAMPAREDAYATYAVFALLLFLLPLCYIRFLATLDTPLKRVLASPVTQSAALALAAASVWLWFTQPGGFVLAMDEAWGYWRVHQGPLNTLLIDGVSVALMLLGLVVALLAWARSPTPLARRQNGWYALAFGVRDGSILAWVLVLNPLVREGRAPASAIAVIPLGELVLVALLAYGILKTQLFDIDLKIKWTLRRGTVAAAFVGVFFVVSEGAQELFSARFGALAGLAAAGALVFAIAPLQRAADRFADATMPRVRDDPEYRTVRKREVYQAAVEGVLEDGEITEKERTVLARLADQLGLSSSEALEIERRASAPRGGRAA